MQISKLESILEDDGIVFLTYGGLISQSLIVGMTEALELEIKGNSMSSKLSIHLLTIFIELSQNMMNYSNKLLLEKSSIDTSGLIIVGHNKKENQYYVYSRNIITNEDKKIIAPKIKQILPLNKDELKKLYRELRKSGREKHTKGAGIGFVEIARRCDEIQTSFNKINETCHYFILKAIIENK